MPVSTMIIALELCRENTKDDHGTVYVAVDKIRWVEEDGDTMLLIFDGGEHGRLRVWKHKRLERWLNEGINKQNE